MEALNGLKIGERNNYLLMICEGDALNVVRAINGDQEAEEWQGKSLVDAC